MLQASLQKQHRVKVVLQGIQTFLFVSQIVMLECFNCLFRCLFFIPVLNYKCLLLNQKHSVDSQLVRNASKFPSGCNHQFDAIIHERRVRFFSSVKQLLLFHDLKTLLIGCDFFHGWWMMMLINEQRTWKSVLHFSFRGLLTVNIQLDFEMAFCTGFNWHSI